MGCHTCGIDVCPRERLSDWNGNTVSSRDAASPCCGVDTDCFYLVEKAAISFLFAIDGAVRSWLRFASRVLGCAECRDASRGAISCAEKFKSAWGTRPLRFHGLGEDVAVPCQGLLPGSVEVERRSDQPGRYSAARVRHTGRKGTSGGDPRAIQR